MKTEEQKAEIREYVSKLLSGYCVEYRTINEKEEWLITSKTRDVFFQQNNLLPFEVKEEVFVSLKGYPRHIGKVINVKDGEYYYEGFNGCGVWTTNSFYSINDSVYPIPAIHEKNLPILNALKDIGSERYAEYKEKILIKEAEKRGFKEGASVGSWGSNNFLRILGKSDYIFSNYQGQIRMMYDGYVLFQLEEWATIVEETKPNIYEIRKELNAATDRMLDVVNKIKETWISENN